MVLVTRKTTTTTLLGRLAALDVGVASPDAAGAGVDSTVSMYERKRAVYAEHFPVLRNQGIQYAPVVWSAYGRPHPDASRVLLTLARQTARRRGETTFRGLARRWAARIAAAIWRRAGQRRPRPWAELVGVGGPALGGLCGGFLLVFLQW